MERLFSRSWKLTALSVALILSVSLNVLLSHRLRILTNLRSAATAEYELKVGTAVPAIEAKRLGGRTDIISYQGTNQPTVLYVFTPACVWCARNLDNLKTLADKDDQYRFIALSLSEEGLAEYVDKNGFKFPVYSDLSRETRAVYKLSGTPQTIVISPEGRVLRNWIGAYVGGQKSEIEAFFHVALPGIRPSSS